MDKKRRLEKIEKLEKTTPGQMLKYPNVDPSANELLIKYTIWKDIKVFSTFFDRLEEKWELLEDIEVGKVQIPRTPLVNHKMNVYLSIALEAERRFKQTYVETNDVRK